MGSHYTYLHEILPSDKEGKGETICAISRQRDRTDIHKPVISLCSNQSTLFHFLSFLLGKQLPPCCLFSRTTGVKQENQPFWLAKEPTENKEILFYSLTNFWIGFLFVLLLNTDWFMYWFPNFRTSWIGF